MAPNVHPPHFRPPAPVIVYPNPMDGTPRGMAIAPVDIQNVAPAQEIDIPEARHEPVNEPNFDPQPGGIVNPDPNFEGIPGWLFDGENAEPAAPDPIWGVPEGFFGQDAPAPEAGPRGYDAIGDVNIPDWLFADPEPAAAPNPDFDIGGGFEIQIDPAYEGGMGAIDPNFDPNPADGWDSDWSGEWDRTPEVEGWNN